MAFCLLWSQIVENLYSALTYAGNQPLYLKTLGTFLLPPRLAPLWPQGKRREGDSENGTGKEQKPDPSYLLFFSYLSPISGSRWRKSPR